MQEPSFDLRLLTLAGSFAAYPILSNPISMHLPSLPPQSSPLENASTLAVALLAARSSGSGSDVVLTYPSPDEGERTLTRQRLWDRVERTVTFLDRAAPNASARILIASDDDAAVLVLFIAALSRGDCPIVIDPGSKADEVRHILSLAEPTLAFVDTPLIDAWPLSNVPNVVAPKIVAPKIVAPKIVAIDGAKADRSSLLGGLLARFKAAPTSTDTFPGLLDALPVASNPIRPVDDDRDAYVLFTSGSTSRPTGVRIGRRALLLHTRTITRQWRIGPTSRVSDVLPLHHADGLIHGVVMPLLVGATIHRPVRFAVHRTAQLLDAIFRDGVTHFISVPTMLRLLLDGARNRHDAFSSPSFVCIVSTAGPLDAGLWSELMQRFRVRVANCYGLTETVIGGCFAGPDDDTLIVGTVGRPVDCEAVIVDESGHAAAPGQPGELRFRGPAMMRGYLGDPALTEATVEDGWLRTGDLAAIDEHGVVRIVGRKKSTVISGGRNVQPEEVAEVMTSIDGVREAVAFGLPDAVFGEILVACAVLDEGANVDGNAIVSVCRARLSSYKVPREVLIIDALPRGPSGKVAMPQLRARYAEYRTLPIDIETSSSDLRARVAAVAARVLRVDVTTLNDNAGPANAVGWDSLAHLAFVSELERSFGVRLSTRDVMDIHSLRDAARIVSSQVRS